MAESMIDELVESLIVHDSTDKIGFMLYEFLFASGYNNDEIREISYAMSDIVS
jgi:hypothetical protein